MKWLTQRLLIFLSAVSITLGPHVKRSHTRISITNANGWCYNLFLNIQCNSSSTQFVPINGVILNVVKGNLISGQFSGCGWDFRKCVFVLSNGIVCVSCIFCNRTFLSCDWTFFSCMWTFSSRDWTFSSCKRTYSSCVWTFPGCKRAFSSCEWTFSCSNRTVSGHIRTFRIIKVSAGDFSGCACSSRYSDHSTAYWSLQPPSWKHFGFYLLNYNFTCISQIRDRIATLVLFISITLVLLSYTYITITLTRWTVNAPRSPDCIVRV